MNAIFPFGISTNALPTTFWHHDGKLKHNSFPYNTSTSALLKTTLQSERNLMHTRFPCILRENITTRALLTTTFHHEGKLECPYSTRKSLLPKKHCIVNKI